MCVEIETRAAKNSNVALYTQAYGTYEQVESCASNNVYRPRRTTMNGHVLCLIDDPLHCIDNWDGA